MQISKVEAIRIAEPQWEDMPWWCTGPTDALAGGPQTLRERQSGLFNRRPGGPKDEVFAVIVRVSTTDGLHGLGCIALGSEAAATIVERHLAPLVLGASPFDTEFLWELMFRSSVNIGRRGLVLAAISGIDIAIWDILGKALGQPVYNLIGGRTRSSIRAYLSSGYAMEDLDRLGEIARTHLADGYTAMKMRFGYGPVDGRAGMRKNVELVKTLRDAIGDDVDLMGDAYMGWNRQYAIEMIRMLEDYNLAWVEEPLMPDDIDGYAAVKAASRTAIAAGEHEATRWGFRAMIQSKAVDYIQFDANRVGGLTESRKIIALAAAHDLPCVPHGPNYHNAHLVMANTHMPLIEMFPRDYRDGDTFIAELFTGDPVARGGQVTLSEQPGMGVKLNMDVVEKYRVRR
ncbi:enolase C-terminal domain-like protein [Chelativorans sp. YIM 93263]|uniref:enolase C-terminal domain-like protein n=1 Tax=Chelativorans sp. YIM 93263 TaxID=2906648 RepID=UPI0023780E00|nr:enolase C-terminal domain-like protein [Chelativorans sp. YIM 93263]